MHGMNSTKCASRFTMQSAQVAPLGYTGLLDPRIQRKEQERSLWEAYVLLLLSFLTIPGFALRFFGLWVCLWGRWDAGFDGMMGNRSGKGTGQYLCLTWLEDDYGLSCINSWVTRGGVCFDAERRLIMAKGLKFNSINLSNKSAVTSGVWNRRWVDFSSPTSLCCEW